MSREHRALLGSSAVDLVNGSGGELLEAWLGGSTPRTLEAYRADLADFASFCGRSPVDAARTLVGLGLGEANRMVLAYRAHLLERSLAPATINRRLAALRSLVRLARTIGLIPWTLEVRGVRTESYRDTRGPGRAGVRRILATLQTPSDAKGARDRAIVHLLYDLALRRGEVVTLDREHLDLEGDRLSIRGKGHRERTTLTLPAPTHEALAGWCRFRGDAPGPLFVGLARGSSGGRLDGSSIYRLIRQLGVRAGVRARPHGLRHAAITEALDLTGGDLRAVQRYARHRDVKVLAVYDDSRADLAGEVARRVATGV